MIDRKTIVEKIGEPDEKMSNFIFSLTFDEICLNINDAVFNMAEAYGRGNQEEMDKARDEYFKRDQLLDKAILHIENGKHDWDWQWLADDGHLCDHDWIWFKEDLEKAGVSREEFDKKWK